MIEIKEYLQSNKEEMLNVLGKLVSFPSVEAHDSEHPFGKANAECLDYALSLCEELGMKTTNNDYYYGFGEIGKGEELIGIIGHLDVVPAGKGWDNDPFTLVIKEGNAYGCGL